MSDLISLTALTINGRPISLSEALHLWKVEGSLQRLLEHLLEDQLVAETARTEHVSVSDEELQAAADAYRKQHGLHKAADTEVWLAEQRLTIDDLQASVERPLLRKKLATHLAASHLDRYFVEHRSDFDRVRLSQIVVDKEGIAAELLSQIVEDGVDFAVLARKHSLDQTSREAGGFLGVAPRKRLAPAVEAAVFGAKAGDVVGPFKTAQGFCLVRVEEIIPAQLDERTVDTIRERLFAEWLHQRKARATVERPLLSSV